MQRQETIVDQVAGRSSLAETPESAGMLKYFAQICLQIYTSFLQIYDVPRTYEQSDGRQKEDKAVFFDI